ncbi:Peptide methionine sulfoxide reductase B3 [Aspergillus fumigatus]|uniref:Peptide-methionine (R)-S-oxide reductase n=1 Tax=Aspergillus fumigatus (strain ATCC MYA-4609 / CBS 101355 / FGSC A1100 / Af293) TaxID=330879 RepID=Q4WN27_ASPFU|nr:methionine-R-sulfoxide reductase SelR, putative [Aspergillus fumigatus Af293]EAL88637.2 methionine-R-sulfoxide reductase SelR, putative [Aspergillus fumigatus Af293]KEY83545.1 methionine R sulfoxide reductase SelR [Aspergillus fumigatus]
MRFQHFTRFLRILTTAPSITSLSPRSITRIPFPVSRATALKAAPTIPFLSSFFSSSAKAEESNMSYPEQRSEAEWRAVLSPEQFRVLREKGTEPPYTGEYDSHFSSKGVYTCAGCNAPLYKATHKFKSGCGWPAYFDSIPGAVTRHTDRSFGMERTEIVCSNCGGHLGHVFKGEGYPTPTDERHCVNSISLKFTEDEEAAKSKA